MKAPEIPAVRDVFAFGPIATVPILAGGFFLWLGRNGPLGPKNPQLMLAGCLMAFGFAAWRCRRVKGWHVYRRVYIYSAWAIATVLLWLLVAGAFAFALLAGRFPFVATHS
jgi:hypothetical protein